MNYFANTTRPEADLWQFHTTPRQSWRNSFSSPSGCLNHHVSLWQRVQCGCSHFKNGTLNWFHRRPTTLFMSNNTDFNEISHTLPDRISINHTFCLRRVVFVCYFWRGERRGQPIISEDTVLASRWHQHQKQYNLYNMSPCISHSCLCERLTGLALPQTICFGSLSSLIPWSSIDKFHVCIMIKYTWNKAIIQKHVIWEKKLHVL